MQRSALETLSRLVLAVALGAGLALGCGAHEGARGEAKRPPAAPSAAPSTTAVAAAPEPAAPPPLPPSPPADPLGPLGADLSRALAAIPPDPAPPKLTMNTHYLVSNEDRPQGFHDAVAGRGGVYVGVGAEQSFMFGGWARAELLFLMDFDAWVVDINEVYGLLFEHARTPDELFDLWGPEHVTEVKAWIAQSSPDHATAEKRAKIYERGQPQVQYRLKWLRRRFSELERPFFANDQAEFDHVARLWKNGRVRCVRGDLTASGTLHAFGDLARRAGWVVRVLYMSNAELYFPYETGAFRENLRSLPVDDRSIVLHTHPTEKTKYFYIWQDAQSYLPWIARTRTFPELLREAKVPLFGKLENGAFRIEPPP